MPFQEYFRNVSSGGTLRGGDAHLHVGQAADFAAIKTHEVGVIDVAVVVGRQHFETPNVIAQVEAG